MELFYLALIQIIISIVLSIVIFFISYKILIKIFKLEESEFNNDNLALSIFFSGIIFSIGYLLSGIIPSIINAIQLIKIHSEGNLFVEVLKYSSMCLFVGFLAISILQISSFLLVKTMTKHIKEVEQLKQNNLAVSILLVSILISITLISADSLIFLLETFLPQPEFIQYN
ncbi:DUF350 domain-containing protein [Maribacter algarum]|uniref:DUF350 domain-containing protein n=1 Tax=Maribacter algarum (ex Zhang et al. 2020) TaxID=2578118 RepID=A0A5S3PRG1_9FLAO|nr:DUF350 domain-containing protein [Maribacter algarum]TMM57274.1 DUF350 domain-containing protein [Maribacter algarum]